MMLTHHYTELSKANDRFLTQLVSVIPNVTSKDPMWGNLGGFAGKEIMLLIGWWVSWAILHNILKHRQVKPRTLILGLLSLSLTKLKLVPIIPLTCGNTSEYSPKKSPCSTMTDGDVISPKQEDPQRFHKSGGLPPSIQGHWGWVY
jgi:hypothetical protein